MLAGPIENYTFRASTPTEELEVMCRMLTEVAGYASTFTDRAHIAQARKCEATQRKVERELIRREGKTAVDEIFKTPQSLINADDLTALSIDELEQLFRQRPKRIGQRLAEGRDISGHFFETRIVRELSRRQASTPIEQLKKDYCLRINRQELDNLSVLTQMPLGTPRTDIAPDASPRALEKAIRRLQHPKTVMEREALQACIDQGTTLLTTLPSKQQGARLAATLIVTGWKGQQTATWLTAYLLQALKDWQEVPTQPDTEMVLPLLTAYQETQDAGYQRKARRIINRCYKAVTTPNTELDTPSDFINDMYIAVKCSDYVTRFSRRKVMKAWTEFCGNVDISVLGERQKERFCVVSRELTGIGNMNFVVHPLKITSELKQHP